MNKYKYMGGALALMLLMGAGSVLAEETNTGTVTPVRGRVQELKDAAKEKAGEIREKVTEKAREVRDVAREKKTEIRSDIQARKEQARAELNTKKEEAKAIIEAKRKEATALRETKKAELQERLKALKDEKKKEIVGRVAEKFGDINLRMTSHLEKAVEKIEALIRRVENRADALETQGADVAAVRSAMTEVFTATEAARAVIAVQAGKVYAIGDVIQNEETIGQNIAGLRETLRNDLKIVQDAVQATKEKVRLAGEALKSVVVSPTDENTEESGE